MPEHWPVPGLGPVGPWSPCCIGSGDGGHLAVQAAGQVVRSPLALATGHLVSSQPTLVTKVPEKTYSFRLNSGKCDVKFY